MNKEPIVLDSCARQQDRLRDLEIGTEEREGGSVVIKRTGRV